MFSQTRSTSTDMNSEFISQFKVGRQFTSRDELKDTIRAFGKKFNVVFSINDPHPKEGQFEYICKHR